MHFTVETINSEGWDTIHKAAYCGNYDILLEELNSGISANHVSNALKSKCKQSLSKDFDVYFSNISPLYMAAQKGHTKCIKLLIERGADPYMLAKNEYFNSKCNAFEVAFWCDKFLTYRLMKRMTRNKKSEITSNEYDKILQLKSNNLKESLISS